MTEHFELYFIKLFEVKFCSVWTEPIFLFNPAYSLHTVLFFVVLSS